MQVSQLEAGSPECFEELPTLQQRPSSISMFSRIASDRRQDRNRCDFFFRTLCPPVGARSQCKLRSATRRESARGGGFKPTTLFEHLMQNRGEAANARCAATAMATPVGDVRGGCGGAHRGMDAGRARTGKEPQESEGFGPPSAPDLKAEHYQAATAGALQFRVGVTPIPLRRGWPWQGGSQPLAAPLRPE